MSTTAKYNFNFLIPIGLTDYPVPFQGFHKGVDENGTDLGFYSYNELMAFDGNKAFYTPSNTHAIMSMNVTSIFDLATKFPFYIQSISPNTIIKEGVDVATWSDVDQSNYLWILSTEPHVAYTYDEFVKVSPLFNTPTEVIV